MDWQVTATTIKCDSVNDFAVLMVYGDGRARCNYSERCNTARDKAIKLANCAGPDCTKLAEFKERAFTL